MYFDFRIYVVREFSRMNFEIYLIGVVVLLMESYCYRDLVDVVIVLKVGFRLDRLVYFFGVGYFMIFVLVVVMGIDFFDLVSYVFYVKDDCYMIFEGIKRFEEFEYFLCFCFVCFCYML